jgi:predicted MFS family arabinose efflux permease
MTGTRPPDFPWRALLALAAAGFLAIITETIPAGLLPELSEGLGVTESAAGQLVTLYALGSVSAAIPLVASTRTLGRRRVLLGAVAGLLVFNTVTALAPWFWLILVARFAAGAAAALVWGVLAGFARRLVPVPQQGRALTVSGIGQPIALAAGVPLGTLFASFVDWRWVFAGISVAAVLLAGWILTVVPEVPGETSGPSGSTASGHQKSLWSVLTLPGVLPVLGVALVWVLAHNTLYTYISPVLEPTGLNPAAGLAVFGVCSFLGITVTGLVIDRSVRSTVLIALVLTGTAAVVLANAGAGAVVACIAVAVWGFGFGGAPSLLQTALADRAGERVDAAQSVFVTVFNAAVAGGGLVGGGLLAVTGTASSLGWVAAVLVIVGLGVVVSARRAFPTGVR